MHEIIVRNRRLKLCRLSSSRRKSSRAVQHKSDKGLRIAILSPSQAAIAHSRRKAQLRTSLPGSAPHSPKYPSQPSTNTSEEGGFWLVEAKQHPPPLSTSYTYVTTGFKLLRSGAYLLCTGHRCGHCQRMGFLKISETVINLSGRALAPTSMYEEDRAKGHSCLW